jgi:hypothetical protein
LGVRFRYLLVVLVAATAVVLVWHSTRLGETEAAHARMVERAMRVAFDVTVSCEGNTGEFTCVDPALNCDQGVDMDCWTGGCQIMLGVRAKTGEAEDFYYCTQGTTRCSTVPYSNCEDGRVCVVDNHDARGLRVDVARTRVLATKIACPTVAEIRTSSSQPYADAQVTGSEA